MRKRTKKEEPVPQINTCGECAIGKWVEDFSNMDLTGKPILLTCPHKEFKILRRNPACEKFTKKTTNVWKQEQNIMDD